MPAFWRRTPYPLGEVKPVSISLYSIRKPAQKHEACNPQKHCIAACTTKTPSTPEDMQTPMAQPVRLPSIKEWPSLVGREADAVRPYVDCSLSIGRHPDRFVLTLLGETGHGKTKTINRLIDNNLLEVAQRCAGSTTKVVQRVNVPSTFNSEGHLIELTVSFDDTPGFGSTITTDRERHQELMDKYAENHFPKLDESLQIYPNVILIVASWESVKEDDHFTPTIDKTIQYLSKSRMVDNQRGNVIVVVTKSLSFLTDYEDVGSQKKKDACWREDVEKKKSIINGLRSKAFGGGDSEWPIVFVENGGGTSAKPRRLPNDESYPQNLFNAIKNLVCLPGTDQPQDLVGIAALQYLTGVLQPSGRPTTEILVGDQPEDVPNPSGSNDERPMSTSANRSAIPPLLPSPVWSNSGLFGKLLPSRSRKKTLDVQENGGANRSIGRERRKSLDVAVDRSSKVMSIPDSSKVALPYKQTKNAGSSAALDNQKGLWRFKQLYDVRSYLAKGLKNFRKTNGVSTQVT